MSFKKNKRNYLTFFLFILVFAGMLKAQTYPYPSQERVDTLLEEIQECKVLLQKMQESLDAMNATPESTTLKEYLDTKKLIEVGERCIADRRKELDKLREEYPGWFNGTGSVLSSKRNREIAGEDIEKEWLKIDILMRQLRESFDDIDKPKDHK